VVRARPQRRGVMDPAHEVHLRDDLVDDYEEQPDDRSVACPAAQLGTVSGEHPVATELETPGAT